MEPDGGLAAVVIDPRPLLVLFVGFAESSAWKCLVASLGAIRRRRLGRRRVGLRRRVGRIRALSVSHYLMSRSSRRDEYRRVAPNPLCSQAAEQGLEPRLPAPKPRTCLVADRCSVPDKHVQRVRVRLGAAQFVTWVVT
jgi:hypothetical protein